MPMEKGGQLPLSLESLLAPGKEGQLPDSEDTVVVLCHHQNISNAQMADAVVLKWVVLAKSSFPSVRMLVQVLRHETREIVEAIAGWR